MSLSAKNRSAILQGLSTVIPESEAVEEMLANFAARDADEWATKDFIRAEVQTVRAEMATMRTEIHLDVQRIIMWMVGTNLAVLGVLFALIHLTA
ncbi:hypothetical protein BH24ACT4_BH24ACT4_25930 [soil metagenome]